MKSAAINDLQKILISAADLERANLNEWERLELHLLDQAAVVIPGKMTVMEVIQTVEALQGLAADLLTAIGEACEKCDGCGVEQFCDIMNRDVHSELHVPLQVLDQAGFATDDKLTCRVDPQSGAISIVQADYRYDLSDVPPNILATFRECGICLNDLETKLINEDIIYGG